MFESLVQDNIQIIIRGNPLLCMASEYISKEIYSLMFDSFGPRTTYNMRVIIKGNLLLDNCMRRSETTYSVSYVWHKYNVQVSIEENLLFNDKPELYSQVLQSFFFENGWLKNTGCDLDSGWINIPIMPRPSSFCLLKTS